MELLKDWSKLEKDARSKSFGNRLATKRTPREKGTNPRAVGTNPRAKGTNPRADKRDKKSRKYAKKFAIIVLGKSERPCPHCGGEMIIRSRKEITDKQKRQYWYYTQWDYCVPCKHVFFDENYKVLNPKGVVLEEQKQQQEFISSI